MKFVTGLSRHSTTLTFHSELERSAIASGHAPAVSVSTGSGSADSRQKRIRRVKSNCPHCLSDNGEPVCLKPCQTVWHCLCVTGPALAGQFKSSCQAWTKLSSVSEFFILVSIWPVWHSLLFPKLQTLRCQPMQPGCAVL